MLAGFCWALLSALVEGRQEGLPWQELADARTAKTRKNHTLAIIWILISEWEFIKLHIAKAPVPTAVLQYCMASKSLSRFYYRV